MATQKRSKKAQQKAIEQGPMVSFLARLLPLAFAFVAKEDTRYYLNGVCLQRNPKGGVDIIGTNGHHVVVCHDPNGVFEGDKGEWIINVDSKTLTQCRRKTATTIVFYPTAVQSDVQMCEVKHDTGAYTSFIFNWIDGKFPDWHRSIDRSTAHYSKANELPMFNCDLLAKWKDLETALPPSEKFMSIDLYASEQADSPILIKTSSPYIFGVIMPMGRGRKGKEPDASLPSWF